MSEQLFFEFMKDLPKEDIVGSAIDLSDLFIIYDNENKIYPFDIFFNSKEAALTYLDIRREGRPAPQYYYKIHKWGISEVIDL
jgi:hypothetical protein